MRYAMIGYGRMGQAVDRQAAERGHERVVIVEDGADADAAALTRRLGDARMAFEFTVGSAAESNLLSLIRAEVSVVCGTTGWRPSDALHESIAGSSAGVLIAPNFSVGVNLFFLIAEHAARLLGTADLHDPFIHEAHHRGKQDAPSGTARRLASIVLAADPRLKGVHEGHPEGALPEGTLQVVSTRAGSEPGMHLLGFDGKHDLITVQHRARGREGFALGAVLAAEWLEGKPGLHTFDEVLASMLERED